MNCYIPILITLMALARMIQSLPDPINNGSKYLMSSSVTGDGYYLGCGDDQFCSMVNIQGAEEHDGWTVVEKADGTVRLYIRDGTWALDVQSSGDEIFADATLTDLNIGEVWQLGSWPDGTYQVYNNGWKRTLDVRDNQTPFVNPSSNSDLMGQHWYFRSVEPQVTVTATTTSTYTVNVYASSTTTVAVTTCLGKRGEANGTPLLKKRGAEILSVTTQTSWSTSIVTVTEITSTLVLTNTATVYSCQAVTVSTATAPGTTIFGTTNSAAVITSTSVPSSSSSPDPSASHSKAWIAGAVLGPIAGLALIGFGVLFCLRRSRRPTPMPSDQLIEAPPEGTTPMFIPASYPEQATLQTESPAPTNSQTTTTMSPNYNAYLGWNTDLY